MTDKMTLTINGETVAEGEKYTYTIDKTEPTDKVEVIASRKDKISARTKYTINFGMQAATTVPDYTGIWTMAGVDAYNSYTVDALTPRTASEIDKENSWIADLDANGYHDIAEGMSGWGKWSYPIVVNGYIYIADDDKLSKYDMNGKRVAYTVMPSRVLGGGYTGWLAYGGGYIYVPTGTSIMAFNANDLSMVWQGNSGITTGYQSSSQILYHDGYVYSGVTIGNESGGGFYCFEITDEDTSVGSELKSPEWVLAEGTSFYWAGAAIVGDYLLVGCDSGLVYCIDLQASIDAGSPVIADTIQPTGKRGNIRNSIVYNEESGQIYFNVGKEKDDGTAQLYAVDFSSSDGKFGKASNVKNLITVPNQTVAVHNGRIYSSDKNCNLNVIDAKTLNIIYTAEAPKQEKVTYSGMSRLTISTAYAEPGNDETVYVYVNSNSNPNTQYVLRDRQSSTEGTVETLNITEYRPQFSTSQLVVADDGSLLYVNDSAQLYCLKSTVTDEQVNKEKHQNQEKANEVIALINAIGKVTLKTEGAINKAVTSYNALTIAQRELVTNHSVLERAVQTLSQLKVEECQRLINVIGKVTLNCKDEIAAARTYYDALTADQQKKVSNYKKLTAAEKALAGLKDKLNKDSNSDNRGKTGNQNKDNTGKPGGITKGVDVTIDDVTYTISEATKKVVDSIQKLLSDDSGKTLPENFSALTQQQINDILDLYKLYDELSDDEKLFVENYPYFEQVLNKLGDEFHRDKESGVDVRGNNELPWNVKINVTPGLVTDKELAKIRETLGEDANMMILCDIRFTDMLTGTEYIPDGLVKVRMPGVESDYDTIVIVHIKDDGSYEYIECDVEDGYITFEASGFSMYGVAGFTGTLADVISQPEEETSDMPWLWIGLGILGVIVLIVLLVIRKGSDTQKKA